MKQYVCAKNIQQPKGRVFVKDKGKKEIKVNLHFNDRGDSLQKIMERNVFDLNKRLP